MSAAPQMAPTANTPYTAEHLAEVAARAYDVAFARGLYTPETLYSLDIETDTTVNGLDQRVARITEVSVSTAFEDVVFNDTDELTLLEQLDEYLGTLPPGLIDTWNGTFFDLPFLSDRSAMTGRNPLGLTIIPAPGREPKYQYLPGHTLGYTGLWTPRSAPQVTHHHFDVMFEFKQQAEELGIGWSLKPVCEANGIKMIVVDREQMHLLTPAERHAYAISDTRGTRGLGLLLHAA